MAGFERIAASNASSTKSIRSLAAAGFVAIGLFDSLLYPELLEVSGDVGAREVVARHQGDIALVELADARLHLDVDTPEEYMAVKALLEREVAGADG